MDLEPAGTDNFLGMMEKDSLKKLVHDYIDDDTNTSTIESHQKDISNSFKLMYGSNYLLHIVDALSFALTDTNVEKRAKGTGLLAECIHQCGPGSLDELEVETLMKFFCDRLKDHHSIQPLVLYAFLGLISYQNVNNQQIVTMLQSIFAEVHVQSLVQADRRNVFNIFSNLLKTKTHILKTFSSEFIFGFIQAMDCERDPRNLLICFENAYLVIKELDFTIFTEDLFEVLSCYFPVEFHEPKEDKFRIKKEDLVDSLKKCLTAEKSFAPFAIPLFLEKLSSDIIEAKSESLVTLTECLKIYNPEDVTVFLDDIWLGIRKDYLLSDYKELDTLYLGYIFNLIKCLSSSSDNESLMKIIDFLIRDCLLTLKDPEMVIAIQCSNVILHASNASHVAFKEVINKLICPLKDGFEKYTSVLQRTNMLEFVSKILCVNNQNIVPGTSLIEFIDYLVPLLYTLLGSDESVTLQVLSLRCLKCILSKPQWFKTFNFNILAHHCFSPVQEKVLSSQFLLEYKSFVAVASQKMPLLFEEYYLRILEKGIIGKCKDKIVSQCLDLLEHTDLNNNEFVNNLYSYFDVFIKLASNANSDSLHIILCYTNILKKYKKDINGKLFVLPLFNFIQSVSSEIELLSKTSYFLSESFKRLNTVERKELYFFVYKIICNRYVNSGNLFGLPITLQLENKLLHVSFLLRGVFTQLRSEDFNEIDIDCVSKELVQVMKSGIDSVALTNFCIVLGTIMNKLPPDSQLAKRYFDLISQSINACEQSSWAVVLLSWITKGLVLNWQSPTAVLIDLMLDCLRKEDVANIAASGFDIIVRELDDGFTKESYASIKLMYKQRYTEYVIPKLIQHYYDADDKVKSFHMIAISSTLYAIPKQMLQRHLKSMMPLLMHSLVTCSSAPITESTLSTISSVLGENKEVVSDYVPSLIPNLLKYVDHDNMKIRILSLKSLAMLSSFTTYVVLPMKSEVIRKVRPVLDDKKRLVRKEAIFCSNAWHLMGSGGKQ